jgi:hypothetical protein
MWAKILRWLPAAVDYLPRVVDAAKAAWSAFRHAPEPQDKPQEPQP